MRDTHFFVALSTTPSSCIVRDDTNQIGKAISPDIPPAKDTCTNNAFSISITGTNPSGPDSPLFSNTHLIIATPPDNDDTQESLSVFRPAGTDVYFVLDPLESLRAGVVHEFGHQMLRALGRPRMAYVVDIEEEYIGIMEAGFIENVLGVQAIPLPKQE